MTMKRLFQPMLCLALLLSAVRAFSAGEKTDGAGLFRQGREFENEGKTNEALWSYRQAAKAGNLNGTLAAGSLLFNLGRERGNREQVLQLAEGLGYLFVAATNRQPQACALLAQGMEKGVGFKTNLVSAYAWMHIAAQGDGAFRGDLDRLVIQLDPEEILQAQNLARDYLSGHWPTNLVRAVDQETRVWWFKG